MTLFCAFVLLVGCPLGFVDSAWTYNLKCHDCWAINSFTCPNVRECPYEFRRCLTVSTRLSPRELLVYKNCTNNCTFVYAAHQPPEAPRKRYFLTNSFYWVSCCNSMTCNYGGPTNLERDILPDYTVEEELEGTVRPGGSTLFLSFVSILVSKTLA
ncbi:glycosyl-phosphatidylinositol-anchored molecule-like protein [Physeter macrocephalus]|uniref:Glycosyl-phosphatidylinositol-anchored molecule-like protein n=1 Tax=Physeter macrocephalus TaxID=9755 RepID=A0A455C5F9_PHYMC|nr:glycosyl-phosphatidylinositol-anchored molecule-like protein [Physeter catodon]|eukprot:XP_028356565.1 glycosyl-phosphatidylinositol-anchored molecule-like protein [Physeter catodon]